MKPIPARTIAKQWLRAFAGSVSEETLAEHVVGEHNFLWHIFSWKYVPCLEGDAAREAFDTLEYDRAITFQSGYSRNGKFQIENLSFTDKALSAEFENVDDLYVVAPDFSWTYVHTHEPDCGPYFCRRDDLTNPIKGENT